MKEQNNNSLNTDDAKATVAIFSSTVAIISSVIYYLLRIGFNDPVLPVLTTLSLSFFLLFLPQGCNLLCQRLQIHFKSTLSRRFPPGATFTSSIWLTTDAAISLLGLIVLTCSGLIASVSNINLLPLFSSVGFILFAINYIRFFYSGNVIKNLVFLTVNILFSVWIASTVWASLWHDPLIEEWLITGTMPQDLIAGLQDQTFYFSITNMIKTYGIPSTGLDGIPYIPYHFGSNWIFAQLSQLLNISPMKFYQIGFPIIFIPFMLKSILFFSLEIRQFINSNLTQHKIREDFMYWLIFTIAYIGVIPYSLSQEMIPWWHKLPMSINSESYTLAIALSFIFFSLILVIFKDFELNKRERRINTILVILVFPLLTSLIGLIKISVSFLIIPTLIYFFIRLKLYKHKSFNWGLCITILLFLIVDKFAVYPAHTSFKFLGYVHQYVGNPWQPFFLLFHFFWSWLFIILKLYEKKIKTLGEFRIAYMNNSIIDIEIIFFLCLLGAAPGTFFDIFDGNAFYFSNFQALVALSFVLASSQNLRSILRRIIA